jgi:succinate dehydrogenase/fumarate reductase flavoprotein subunit
MSSIPERVDVAVAGSGATGLAAALTLAEGGARVAVFEKQRSLGGTSNFFQGTFAVESAMQRERYIDYTRDQAFKNTMDYSHWRANPRLVRAIIDESGPTIAWLQGQGVVFTEATINMPDSPLTYHVIKGRGEAVVKALVDQAKGKGVQILSAAPVVAVLTEGGRATGVVVDDGGAEVEVAAKAVVIATGGFANNKEWVKKYTGYDLGVNLFPVGNTGKTGDGLRMAWEAGAAVDGVETIEMFRVAPVAPEFAMGCNLEQASAQPDLWVTARGERFCDETIGFYDTPVGNAQARYKADGHTFSVFDDSIVERLVERGLDKGVGVDFPPGYRLTELRREIQAALDNKSTEVFAADSLDDLAAQTGMDPTTLRATIDEYNRYCAQGHDELFAKDRRFLRPLVGPKFYAVRARAVFLGTMGGIKVNEKLEVLDKKDAPIPGLYAGGFDAGGMYGDSYPIKSSSGLASAFALNSGRIAGRSALRYVGR